MTFRDFIKEKIVIIGLILFGLITIEIFLMAYPFGIFIKIYIPVSITLLMAIGIFAEYLLKKNYYKEVQNVLDELEEKYLISEIIKMPDFTEGKILKNILDQVDKSMIDNVNRYRYMQEDYKEYIELWIHEIKLPIAASKLVIENNKNDITKSIDEELDKIENYTEQALYYARSNTVEKDYYIKQTKLKDFVNESIKRNKNVLIQERILINIHDIDFVVNTDSKWIIFILNQIIQNSVKYKSKDRKTELEIYAKAGRENITLYIIDNGIGIKSDELSRVFEKGFTGTNGRFPSKKSTGIGLYLSKKLCDKLGVGINLKSEQDKYTEVQIIFPKGSYLDF